MPNEAVLLQGLYARFNARDMESVLELVHDDVKWANGMDGGHVYGRDGVRRYWTHQWAIINPHVEPVGFSMGPDGTVVVDVHQVIRDLGAISCRIESSRTYFESKMDVSSALISATSETGPLLKTWR